MEGTSELNNRNIQSVDVDVSLSLANTRLKTSDFLALKVGDVIATETSINRPAELSVAGQNKFLCRPGLFGKKRAGQIMDIHPSMREE